MSPSPERSELNSSLPSVIVTDAVYADIGTRSETEDDRSIGSSPGSPRGRSLSASSQHSPRSGSSESNTHLQPELSYQQSLARQNAQTVSKILRSDSERLADTRTFIGAAQQADEFRQHATVLQDRCTGGTGLLLCLQKLDTLGSQYHSECQTIHEAIQAGTLESLEKCRTCADGRATSVAGLCKECEISRYVDTNDCLDCRTKDSKSKPNKRIEELNERCYDCYKTSPLHEIDPNWLERHQSKEKTHNDQPLWAMA